MVFGSDSEYIETALLAQRLGQTPIIIIEKLYEIDIVIEASKKLQIKPVVGVRAKLTTQGIGRWGGSTGDHAKFGLSAAEIMEVVKRLKKHDMLSSLQLLHFHIGSQISRISVVKDALREAGQFFVELAKLGTDLPSPCSSRGAAPDGRDVWDGCRLRHEVPGYRWWFGHRLRRFEDQFPRFDELHHRRVRRRRGGGHSEGVRQVQRAGMC